MRLSNIFYAIPAALMLGGSLSAQCPGTLIVNEISNGDSLNREWVELIALPTNSCSGATVDISGLLIDDHNGIYTGGPISGTGISTGHLRLSEIPLFQNFPAGGLLVLYNAGQIDQSASNVLQFAFNTRDAQGVTVQGSSVYIAVGRDGVVEYNSGVPTFSSAEYCSGTYVTGDTNSWNAISLNNSLDAVEVLCQGCSETIGEPFIFHGFGYDAADNMYSHYNNIVSDFYDGALYLYDTLSGARHAFQFFNGTDPGADANWRRIHESNATPGAYNNDTNEAYVLLVLEGELNVGGCSDSVRVIEPGPEAGDAALVITEYSQGTSGGTCEYVEIFVGFAGTTKPGDAANIVGWIVDDNAGTFSTCVSDRGITSGHLRFANNALWQNVPYGSRIILYNPNINCNGFTSTGTTAPSDSTYFVAVGSDVLMEYTSSLPSTGSSCLYCTGTYSAPGNFSVIDMRNAGDGIQVRCPGCPEEPIFYHGSAWGTNMSGLTSPNLGALDLGSASASAQTHEFYQGSNVQSAINWRRTTWTSVSSNLTAGVVPAAFHTAALSGSLNFPFCGDQARSEVFSADDEASAPVTEVHSVYPNPASDVAYIELIAENGGTLNVLDMSGRILQSVQVQALKGEFQRITLDLSDVPAGIYMYTLNDGSQVSIQGKFVVSGK